MSSKAWMCLFCLVLVSGCATSRSDGLTPVCPDTRCIAQAAMVPHYDACMSKLFRGSRGHHDRQSMVEEYGYPFVDASGYFGWRQMGGTGPAPDEWCAQYARQKVASPYGTHMSLN